MYYLREYQKGQGEKATMTGLVKEAIKLFLANHEKEIEQGDCLTLEKELELNELDKQYAQKKIAIAKKKMNPEKLKVIEKLDRFEALERQIKDSNRRLSKTLY